VSGDWALDLACVTARPALDLACGRRRGGATACLDLLLARDDDAAKRAARPEVARRWAVRRRDLGFEMGDEDLRQRGMALYPVPT